MNSTNAAWRMRAVELAVQRGLIGQAILETRTRTSGGLLYETYSCVSASEPEDHTLVLQANNASVDCDCRAGELHKPCAHAGAVLLLHFGLAPERERTPEGLAPNA